MEFPKALIVFICNLLGLLATVKGCSGCLKEIPKLKVDLLLICDKEYAERFNHNLPSILEHWAVLIQDVNAKFMTLPSVDVSFRVSHVLILEKPEDNAFIAKARNRDGTYSFHPLLNEFSKWIYKTQNTLGTHHIAILASGKNFTGKYTTSTFIDGLCPKTILPGQSKNVLILRDTQPLGSICLNLEFSLATLLGAPYDHKSGFDQHCDKSYIMSKIRCGKERFFFSKCSDQAIKSFVKKQNCLYQNKLTPVDIIKPFYKTAKLPSISNQCAAVIGNPKAYAKHENSQCITASCYVRAFGIEIYWTSVYPPNYSPCGVYKYCFLGKCVSKGSHLLNLASEKCLQSLTSSAPRDFVIMENCLKQLTPLNTFTISNFNGLAEKVISTHYISNRKSQLSRECLTVNLIENSLKFTSCSTNNSQVLKWKFHFVQNSNKHFLIYHDVTKSCVFVDDFAKISLNSDCDVHNIRYVWSLVSSEEIESGLDKYKANAKIATKKPALDTSVDGRSQSGSKSEIKNNSHLVDLVYISKPQNCFANCQQEHICQYNFGLTLSIIGFGMLLITLLLLIGICVCQTSINNKRNANGIYLAA